MGNEKKHYEDILSFLINTIQSTFDSQNKQFKVLGDIDSLLSKGIERVCKKENLYYEEIADYVDSLGQLNIDSFIIVINPDNKKFEVIIGEIKDMASVGLKEYSQLIGYCLSSYSKYGLLINANSGSSKNLRDLLTLDKNLCEVNRELSMNSRIKHTFGVFMWDSVTNRIESKNLGGIKSINDLIVHLIKDLET